MENNAVPPVTHELHDIFNRHSYHTGVNNGVGRRCQDQRERSAFTCPGVCEMGWRGGEGRGRETERKMEGRKGWEEETESGKREMDGKKEREGKGKGEGETVRWGRRRCGAKKGGMKKMRREGEERERKGVKRARERKRERGRRGNSPTSSTHELLQIQSYIDIVA